MHSQDRLPAEQIPLPDYVSRDFVPLSHLEHNWELHTAVSLTPAEDRLMVREPAAAVPRAIAERLGALRVLIVPFIGCFAGNDMVCFQKPEVETHSSAWLEVEGRINLVLACRELDAHDTGFEFLATIGELVRPRLTAFERERYSAILEDELRRGVPGEIDEEARAAKQPLTTERQRRRQREAFKRYVEVSFVSTLAEYLHGLWHDVQIRVGPEHLPVTELKRRMNLLSEIFPPNPGYRVFADELESKPEEA